MKVTLRVLQSVSFLNNVKYMQLAVMVTKYSPNLIWLRGPNLNAKWPNPHMKTNN